MYLSKNYVEKDMREEIHPVRIGFSEFVFGFACEGPRGKILKLLTDTRLRDSSNYNLVFGGHRHFEDDFPDRARSNNNRFDKLLSTVAYIVLHFLKHSWGALVVATGSTPNRTRPSQMAISRHGEEIVAEFDVFGLKVGEWQPLDSRVAYIAFGAKVRPP